MIFHEKITPAERGRQRLIANQIITQIKRSEVTGGAGYRRNWAICETIASLKANWDWKRRTAYKRSRAWVRSKP